MMTVKNVADYSVCTADIHVSFLCVVPAPKTEYCEKKLDKEKYQAFEYAVKNHYWYQMYLDDLPVWGR